jgi:nucleotidyltransferase/DNA polymerase involved in DNA repair
VAPNKFLAKIASDWQKPDGLFVIQPENVEPFLSPLPVGRLPGVGKVTERTLEKTGIQARVWAASRKESRIARTVVLKLKTSEFKILTRNHTACSPPSSCEELAEVALLLRERANLAPQQHFRLAGVGLSNFRGPDDASATRPFRVIAHVGEELSQCICYVVWGDSAPLCPRES